MSGYVFVEAEELQMREAYLAKTTQVERNQAEMEAALNALPDEELEKKAGGDFEKNEEEDFAEDEEE